MVATLDPALRLLFTHMQNFNIRPRWFGKVGPQPTSTQDDFNTIIFAIPVAQR
jgi:hypothetical protein